MCLFYAIKRKDRVGVRSLLASGEDANARQGIEGCLPGPGEPGYGSEPDPVQIESAWCMAARDKRPLDVAIQSRCSSAGVRARSARISIISLFRVLIDL